MVQPDALTVLRETREKPNPPPVPMQAQRVEESGQSLHHEQDGDSEDGPGRENEHDHDDARVARDHLPRAVHHHRPQHVRQLYTRSAQLYMHSAHQAPHKQPPYPPVYWSHPCETHPKNNPCSGVFRRKTMKSHADRQDVLLL